LHGGEVVALSGITHGWLLETNSIKREGVDYEVG